MYIQVIAGRATDAEALTAQFENWVSDVRPGAIGLLGGTAGLTDDGRFVILARFEDADAAQRNSERSEQTEWFSQTEPYMADVTFDGCSRVETLFGGGDDAATFVQVMRGTVKDAATADALFAQRDAAEAALRQARPDLLGQVVALHDEGGGVTSAVYFVSESEARANEAKMSDMPPGGAELLAQFDAAFDVQEYFDLQHPMMH